MWYAFYSVAQFTPFMKGCTFIVSQGYFPANFTSWFVFQDHSCGWCSLLPNICQGYGWNPGNRAEELFGNLLDRKLNMGPDVTFKEVRLPRKSTLSVSSYSNPRHLPTKCQDTDGQHCLYEPYKLRKFWTVNYPTHYLYNLVTITKAKLGSHQCNFGSFSFLSQGYKKLVICNWTLIGYSIWERKSDCNKMIQNH